MIADELDVLAIPENKKTHFKLKMVETALGWHWDIPVMVAKGGLGKTLAITAALHGNELNGISIIHALWDEINVEALQGTLVLIPVLNTPGFLNGERTFHDGKDLNRIMPGDANGASSQVYAHAIIEKVVKKVDYLIDLHTASFGHINSLYVKVDLSNEKLAKLALLQNPQLIVDTLGPYGSLRREAIKLGIPAITVEIGDPYLFQKRHVQPSVTGLRNVLIELGMLSGQQVEMTNDPIICKDSNWIFAKSPGILHVYPGLTEQVKKSDIIATVTDVFGNPVDEMTAPYDSFVIGKSTNPLCEVGSRVIHLGVQA